MARISTSFARRRTAAIAVVAAVAVVVPTTALAAGSPPSFFQVNVPGSTYGKVAVASFATSDPDGGAVSYTCSLDQAAFVACTSPFTMSDLALGDHQLTVRATDTEGLSTESSAWWTVYTDLRSKTRPAVSGEPQVGEPLTASSGSWERWVRNSPTVNSGSWQSISANSLTLTYQWEADQSPVTGAVGTTFEPTAAELGARMRVDVTAELAGSHPGRQTSLQTSRVRPGVFKTITAPTVSGTPKYGQTLTATAGVTTPASARVSYRWLRDGRAISGAAGSRATYRVVGDDMYRTLSVEVSHDLPGYLTAARTSATTRKGFSTLSVKTVGSILPGKARVGTYQTPIRGAYKQNPTNPIAGKVMGVYMGPQDQSWAPYVAAKGADKTALGKIALRPKMKWFGAWQSDRTIAESVRNYIENSQEGDPNVLVQMTVFRMDPWYTDACKALPTKAQQESYRLWIRRFAKAVGKTPTAIVLQPDLPFVLCSPGGSMIPQRQVAYAAKEFSKLPNTAVYIDVGAADWPRNDVKLAARILRDSGVKYARGLALNATHYVPTPWDVSHGAKVAQQLARMGMPGKKVVVNTSSNGKGFEFGDAVGVHEDHADACRTKTQRSCVTLGIPPTTIVDDPRWKLPARTRKLARKYVDGYLWFGRPWLFMQTDPFQVPRALQLSRTSPW